MKLPTIPPGLVGKIVKYRPLSEPIRLQDLEDSARSQAWKKEKKCYPQNKQIRMPNKINYPKLHLQNKMDYCDLDDTADLERHKSRTKNHISISSKLCREHQRA